MITKYLRAKLTQIELVQDRGYDASEELGLASLLRNVYQFTPGDELTKLLTKLYPGDHSAVLFSLDNKNDIKRVENITNILARVYTVDQFAIDLFNKTYIHKTDKNKKIYVGYLWTSGDTVSVKLTRDYSNDVLKSGVGDAIMITPVSLTSQSISELTKLESARITNFVLNELIVNVTKHVYQPQYRKLSEQEKTDLLTSAGVGIDGLPILKYADLTYYRNKSKEKDVYWDPIVKYFGFKKRDVIEIKETQFYLNLIVRNVIRYAVVL